jgi:hypothetical protein
MPEDVATGAPDIHTVEAGIARNLDRVERNDDAAASPLRWRPPDFGGHRRTRIGASVVEQFVAGHDASDVLRELVQNEFDGGGDRLSVTFGSDALEVVGNGRGMRAEDWTRLSVIVGTGRVVGGTNPERVAAKANGIGSKNFGLRSLFLFGNEIYLRSNGFVAVLDIRTLETGKVRDEQWRGERGVRLQVPFRDTAFEMLEPFTLERERRAFGLMASGMLATLVKLALGGKPPGLREVTLRSTRTGRTLSWRQRAQADRSRLRGVNLVSRIGRLIARSEQGAEARSTFQEVEFSRILDVPDTYADRGYPAYYRARGGRLKIAVSLPIHGQRIDQSRIGNFYYPLQAPASRTGFSLSVSAPFDLNHDRSSLVDNNWNDWLIDQSAVLTIDLLKGDWLVRYGADAFKVLTPKGQATPARFSQGIARLLKDNACWPTRANGDERFVIASKLVLAKDASLEGFLSESRYLHPALTSDGAVRELAAASGAAHFTLSSLVRLRCAGKDTKALQTKLKDGEANFHFESYDTAMKDLGRQVKMAASLSGMARQLTKANKADLSATTSTLSAIGELLPATELITVDPHIWAACPEPLANRLHPDLVPYKVIAGMGRPFDEEAWLIDAAGRAGLASDEDAERAALYAKLLADGASLSRRAISALRKTPVVRNHRGEWTAPIHMVLLRGNLAHFMAPAVDLPSREMWGAPHLIARLRIRDKLNGTDLVRYAAAIHQRPETADRFEKLLFDHIRLLSSAIVDQLREIPFLRALSGRLVRPDTLHLDTVTNRVCIADPDRIVAGRNAILYRKLRVREVPHSGTLVETLDLARKDSKPPARPDLLYPALVAAMARERRSRADLAERPICWVDGQYHTPMSILVGHHIPAVLEHAIPVFKRSDEVANAYLTLGARGQARDEHWVRFFKYVATEWGPSAPLNNIRRRALLSAYNQRSWQGLPQNIEEIKCLIDRRGYLYCSTDILEGRLVEPDFPLLETALSDAGADVGIVTRSERSRNFFSSLGIRPLSSIAGRGHPMFGGPAERPLWFKPYHREVFLAMLRKPIFTRALHEIAVGQRYSHPGFHPVAFTEMKSRVDAITDIAFFEAISRKYEVAGVSVQIPVDVAVRAGLIGVVAPKTKLDFQHLVAEALAEVVGATNAAQARGLAIAFLPLVLCRSADDMRAHLERMGIDHARWKLADSESFELDDDFIGNVGEEALRQMMQSLATSKENDGSGASSTQTTRSMPSPTAAAPPPPFVLPDLEKVQLIVISPTGEEVEGSGTSGRGSTSHSSGWVPRTTSEIERDRDVGRRGEQLIYRLEMERIRDMGHANPEQLVVWTSLTDPGADHDIQSIHESGGPRWIEVKSTTGVDGRFDWSRKEFERALQERDRYELWRVYRVSDCRPVAKCFRNPAELIALSRITLELGTLRAKVEDLR